MPILFLAAGPLAAVHFLPAAVLRFRLRIPTSPRAAGAATTPGNSLPSRTTSSPTATSPSRRPSRPPRTSPTSSPLNPTPSPHSLDGLGFPQARSPPPSPPTRASSAPASSAPSRPSPRSSCASASPPPRSPASPRSPAATSSAAASSPRCSSGSPIRLPGEAAPGQRLNYWLLTSDLEKVVEPNVAFLRQCG
ncbi:hypothetical protein ZWY2020_037038 [Hordeum vulgare]|nr:hypothetical protein ZWY2020_037038 [Hordeum vulgare]